MSNAPAQLPARPTRSLIRHPLRTLLFIVGILIVLVGITIVITRSGYSKPIDVIVYPQAVLSGTSAANGSDRTIYYTQDAWDRVAQYYAQYLGQSDSQICRAAGDRPLAHCLIDHVTLGYEQTALITIMPDPKQAGQTLIQVDRTWPTN